MDAIKNLDTANIKNQIKSFVIDNFLFGQIEFEFDTADSLLEKGIVDSTGVLELVTFIEETFAFIVADDEITPDNLDSIDNMALYISRKIIG